MEKLEKLIKFFALSNAEKLRWLPRCRPGHYYYIYQTSIQTRNALFCLVYELWDLLDTERVLMAKTEAQDQLLRELWAVLSIMIEGEDLPQSFWDINRSYEGFVDHLWDIVIRYSNIAIEEFHFTGAHSDLLFDELFTVGSTRKGLKKMKYLRVVPPITGFK
jgi:hypothetical protein